MVGVFLIAVQLATVEAQEKIRIAYSSTDTLNSIWTAADDAGFYKKHGLDAEVVYIGSTTVGVAAIVSQDVQIGNAAGRGVGEAGGFEAGHGEGARSFRALCGISSVSAYQANESDRVGLHHVHVS